MVGTNRETNAGNLGLVAPFYFKNWKACGYGLIPKLAWLEYK